MSDDRLTVSFDKSWRGLLKFLIDTPIDWIIKGKPLHFIFYCFHCCKKKRPKFKMDAIEIFSFFPNTHTHIKVYK